MRLYRSSLTFPKTIISTEKSNEMIIKPITCGNLKNRTLIKEKVAQSASKIDIKTRIFNF